MQRRRTPDSFWYQVTIVLLLFYIVWSKFNLSEVARGPGNGGRL